jgi:hypothetical protein
MPFIQTQNLVVEKEVLSEITEQEQKIKPTKSSLIILQGGQGGSFGEKSYKPKVVLAKANINSSELSLASASITNHTTTEIKNENDCGYAIDFKTDASNQCNFTIGQYNPYGDLDIYNRSQLLQFSDVFTGGVSSSTVLNDGDSVGNFTLVSSTSLTPQLDSELNLNKYYLELRNSATVADGFYLQKSINFADVGSSVYIFYVAQTDLADGYASYNTGQISYQKDNLSTQITGGFYHNEFQVGDKINISHPNNYFGINATITQKDPSNIYTLSITKEINTPSSAKNSLIVFPVGSSATIQDVELDGSNKLSITTEQSLSSFTDYNTVFSNPSFGTKFNIGKKITIDQKEILNNVGFSTEGKFLSEQFTSLPIDVSYNRIGSRSYMQDQYGTDVIKNEIKNKTKFGIFYHGIEKTISKNESNTNQASTTYSCGSEISSFISNNQLNQDILNMLQDKTIKIILGSPIKYINGVARCYYSNKIYEVLVYIDLKSSDIPKVLSYLSRKYKEKITFSSPVEFQSTDMYYSITDKINIVGKIKKTST